MTLREEVEKAMRAASVGQEHGEIRQTAISVAVEAVERGRAERQLWFNDTTEAYRKARDAWKERAEAAEAALAERGHEHTATCFTHPLTGLVSVRARCAMRKE